MSKSSVCILALLSLGWFGCRQDSTSAAASKVINTKGLIAFWDFNFLEDTSCRSKYDPAIVDRSYQIKLRRIGDDQPYTPANWPYHDNLSKISYDHSGPFGKAIRFNLGYIYGAVDRVDFDQTKLDLNGTKPFTLIAWVKFVGERHMIAGIWDEGGWDRYQGRRQVALFAGLFGQPGAIAHISATGAASYPQSSVEGAQYARLRAIDGQAFEDDQWICMAATYDPGSQQLIAYLDGEMTPLMISDPVSNDVFQYSTPQPANPFPFHQSIYSPRNFLIKYNGYLHNEDHILEHSLQVNIDEGTLIYRKVALPDDQNRFRVSLDILKRGSTAYGYQQKTEIRDGDTLILPNEIRLEIGDKITTGLEKWHHGQWELVGTPIDKEITTGAPFTFGRALGLGSENIDHGSELYLDGVAVFDRVLSVDELKGLSFVK